MLRAHARTVRIPPIFFHPDYDRRPWHLTRSADPARECGRSRARGNASCNGFHIPPVGTFTPPWRR